MRRLELNTAIIGSGIAGLTVFYYLAEIAKTKTRNAIITKSLANQLNSPFPLGPRYLHVNKSTEFLLEKLGLSTAVMDVNIGYKYPDGTIRNYADEEFKKMYNLKSRGTSKVEASNLTGGGKSSFKAYLTSQTALGSALLDKCLSIAKKSDVNTLIVDSITEVTANRVIAKNTEINTNKVVSTIPFNVLLPLVPSTIKIAVTSKPELVTFAYCEDDNKNTRFDYVYSADPADNWHRKLVVDNDRSVFEAKGSSISVSNIIEKVSMPTQITKSLKLNEFAGIQLVGRYAQMNHAIKTEDVITWAAATINY